MKSFAKRIHAAFVLAVFLFFVNGLNAAMSDEDFLRLCAKGSLEEVRTAIQGGANINAVGKEGFTADFTPVMLAALSNLHPEVITALAKVGADVHVVKG